MKYNVNDFTLEQKIKFLTAVGTWYTYDGDGKVKGVVVSDGPNGLRMRGEVVGCPKKATAMPNLSAVANTWNKEMAYLDGETIADDCCDKGADILLAPGVNIKRTPLNGRNFEYFSEDPYLTGILASEYIKALQDNGVGACIKHFCANNRELDRETQTSEVDERTLREIYMRPFEMAIDIAKPWTLMCSYNPVNGVYASENKKILYDILRKQLGFDGVVISDWGSVHNAYKCHRARLDLQFPDCDDSYQQILDAYNKGLISIEDIDYCAQNVLNLAEKVENNAKLRSVKWNDNGRHKNAVKIAKEAIVLLKNEDNILPLKKGIINLSGLDSESPILGGGGSAFVSTIYEQRPLVDLLNEKLKDCKVNQSKGYLLPNYQVNAKLTYKEIEDSDIAVICVRGDNEEEGKDRISIKLSPNQEQFIINASRINPNIVVCVYAGSAIDMSAWIDCVKGVVFVGYLGEAVNEAVASVLSGETCPSGKLSETFPLSLEDTFTGRENGDGFVEWYNDGIFVGYRYYEKVEKEVLFPFGYGLSYANFEYSNLKIKKKGETDYEITFDVENTSDVDAKEISQVYVRDTLSMVIRPVKELKAFSKDLIKAHSKKKVTLKLDYNSFAYYSTVFDKWHVENGKFDIMVGSSSRDIKLVKRIEINLDDDTQQTFTK